MRAIAALPLAFLLLGVSPAPQDTVGVFFGTLHAHSRLSDGNPSISPERAYQIAREDGHLDFLCLSEHNHMLTPQEMAALINAAEAENGNGFVALIGQEYSTIEHGGNHTNIINYPLAIPKALNGKYQHVFQTLLPGFLATSPSTVIFAGFNHPRSNIQGDYGLGKDFSGDTGDFVEVMDPFVQLIAIGSGPADSNKKNFVPNADEDMEHRDIGFKKWFDYLEMGMHLGPKIDHDTHSPTYGFRVAGRTAVWVRGALTREKLLNALASRHVYATEEPNLKIIATVEDDFMPGDILIPAEEGTLKVVLNITDADEPSAEYTVEVHSGVTGSGNDTVKLGSLTSTRTGNGTVTLALPTEQDIDNYYVIRVIQRSTDPVSACTRDDAWLAPIWVEWTDDEFNEDVNEVAKFVGSKNSKIFHHPECSVVGRIKPSNLVNFDSEPDGKTLHQGCPW